MTADQTQVLLAQVSEDCLCGWPAVIPEMWYRDGRLLLDWTCPIDEVWWNSSSRIPAGSLI